jgi:hypothetical protein
LMDSLPIFCSQTSELLQFPDFSLKKGESHNLIQFPDFS